MQFGPARMLRLVTRIAGASSSGSSAVAAARTTSSSARFSALAPSALPSASTLFSRSFAWWGGSKEEPKKEDESAASSQKGKKQAAPSAAAELIDARKRQQVAAAEVRATEFATRQAYDAAFQSTLAAARSSFKPSSTTSNSTSSSAAPEFNTDLSLKFHVLNAFFTRWAVDVPAPGTIKSAEQLQQYFWSTYGPEKKEQSAEPVVELPPNVTVLINPVVKARRATSRGQVLKQRARIPSRKPSYLIKEAKAAEAAAAAAAAEPQAAQQQQ